ncbi:MAG TPA: large conductance mechanosensitive channel protein MscL [Gemmatimonadaceae bacterium]|nr:large conductance mechanosensitive channel protein MscL [Gemmatimonadaceae bacterium]
MWKDFKAFVMRGNVIDLAVAVVIGGAFGAIVKSLTDDILMPPLGLLTGRLDFSSRYILLQAGTKAPPPYATPAEAKAAGAVTINYGMFINAIITFLIVAAAVFLLVRIVNKLMAQPAPPAPNTKACPQCTLAVPLAAVRCPNCTAQIG